MADDPREATLIGPLDLEQLAQDRARFVQRLVLSLALEPPKALERALRARPIALRRQPAGR